MFRKASAEDVLGIKEIVKANELFPEAILDEMIQSYLNPSDDEDDDHIWFVNTREDYDKSSLAAFCYCVADKNVAGVYYNKLLAVDPQVHQKGYGKMLLKAVEYFLAKLKQARLMLIETSSDETYDGPRKFYEALGYEEEGRIREFYSETEDKIIHRKKIVIEDEMSC